MLSIQIDTKDLELLIYHQFNNIKVSFFTSHMKSSFPLWSFDRCCTDIRYAIVRALFLLLQAPSSKVGIKGLRAISDSSSVARSRALMNCPIWWKLTFFFFLLLHKRGFLFNCSGSNKAFEESFSGDERISSSSHSSFARPSFQPIFLLEQKTDTHYFSLVGLDDEDCRKISFFPSFVFSPCFHFCFKGR